MSVMQRRKGGRLERAIVNWHRERGYFCERVPLSGATRFQQRAHDIDSYVFGRETAPLTFEVKGRAGKSTKSGTGFKMLYTWLGTADALALIANNQPPLFVLTESAYERLLTAAKRAP